MAGTSSNEQGQGEPRDGLAAEAAADRPSGVGKAGPAPGGDHAGDAPEVVRLEELLLDQGRRLRALEREHARERRLFLGLMGQLEVGFTLPGVGPGSRAAASESDGLASLRKARDAAQARAVEAEAARAELVFRLDEVLGHLAQAAGRASDAPAVAVPAVAAVPERARTQASALAEAEEALANTRGRLMLLEDDLAAARGRIRSLERELVEQGDQLELEIVRARTRPAAAPSAGQVAVGGPIPALRGELQGLRARLLETEMALEAATAACHVHERSAEAGRQALVDARASQAAAVARAEAVSAQLVDASARQQDLQAELSALQAESTGPRERCARLEAELRGLRDDLAQAKGKLDAVSAERDRLAAAHGESVAAARDAEATRASDVAAARAEGRQVAAQEVQSVVAGLRETLVDARTALVEVGRCLSEASHSATDGDGEAAGLLSGRLKAPPGTPSTPAPDGPSADSADEGSPGAGGDAGADTTPGVPAGVTRQDLERELIELREALETERAAHAASVASHMAQTKRSQAETDEKTNLLEVYRGRLRRVAEAASGLRGTVSASDPLATKVSELISIARD